MPSVNRVFQGAQALGDASSLRDFGKWPTRIRSRVGGRGLGFAQARLSVFGLIAWAQFFNWLTNQVRADAAEPRVVGTFASYAAGYEYGFSNPSGNRRQRPFFRKAVQEARAEILSGSGPQKPLKIGRSGLYLGGKHSIDIHSLITGDVSRLATRAAGKETTRFFWGALTNPETNVVEKVAKLVVRKARKNVEDEGLVDTGALKHSITWAKDFGELKQKSYDAISRHAAGDPRIDRRFGEL